MVGADNVHLLTTDDYSLQFENSKSQPSFRYYNNWIDTPYEDADGDCSYIGFRTKAVMKASSS